MSAAAANRELARAELAGGRRLAILLGDLTVERADALVNAANRELQHGGALALALARAGGPAIQAESDAWIAREGAVATGSCAVTGGGRLPCRWLIHAVGPIWEGGGAREDALLASAVDASLDAAERLGCASLALPAISAGTYGFPRERCARISVERVAQWCRAHPGSALREIRFVLFGAELAQLFERELRALSGS